MGPDNQNFPNNNLGSNMPVMGPQPTPAPGSGQPVMGVPQPVPDVQPEPVMPQPEPTMPQLVQPEPMSTPFVRSETPQPAVSEPMLGAQPMPEQPIQGQPIPGQPVPEQPSMPGENPMSGPKSKKNLMIIGAIAGVVVIALVIAIIVIMNSGKKSSQPVNPEYNDQVTEPDENGDINGDGSNGNVSEADTERVKDYSTVVTAVNNYMASNNGEISKLVQTKNPANLNPAKWINETGKDPEGNSYELKAYSFDKWQSEGDLVPAISDSTNGSQVFIIIGASCTNVDANGNLQPAMDEGLRAFAVYGYLENGLFCQDSGASGTSTTADTTTDDFDF